jgi:antitoxin HigA-1
VRRSRKAVGLIALVGSNPTLSAINTITNMSTKKSLSIHPGEILLEEFLKPHKLSQYRLAKDINVPARRINEIIHGTRAITTDTALRLARYFGMSPEFWLGLQTHFELETHKDNLESKFEDEVKVLQPA